VPRLSEKARKNKVAYNMKRNKELYGKFQALIPKEEYQELCDFLNSVKMNKTEFIRWAFEKLKEDY
jgi:chemotaxis methyl-accepting protein methylase